MHMPDKIHLNVVPPDELRLPTEILAIIINELALDSTGDNDRTLAALTSCRLASHVLYSLTTPLLFSSIELTDDVRLFTSRKDRLVASNLLWTRATKLRQILTTDDVAASVQNFTLRCHPENLTSQTNGTLISTILHRLPHIQRFSLEALETNSERGFLLFSLMTDGFSSAIQVMCRSPSLTTLYLDNIKGFPATAIAACPNLQCLHLWCVEPSVNFKFFVFFLFSRQLILYSSSPT